MVPGNTGRAQGQTRLVQLVPGAVGGFACGREGCRKHVLASRHPAPPGQGDLVENVEESVYLAGVASGHSQGQRRTGAAMAQLATAALTPAFIECVPDAEKLIGCAV